RGLIPERHEEATRKRRTVDDHRTAPAAGAAQAEGRPASGPEPRGPDRHHLRLEEWHPLGDAALRDGLWQRRDLLATTPRLAAGRRLGALAPGLAEPARRGRPD